MSATNGRKQLNFATALCDLRLRVMESSATGFLEADIVLAVFWVRWYAESFLDTVLTAALSMRAVSICNL